MESFSRCFVIQRLPWALVQPSCHGVESGLRVDRQVREHERSGDRHHGGSTDAQREITDENLPNDTTQWRLWYSQHGSERLNHFQQANQQYVLGNS